LGAKIQKNGEKTHIQLRIMNYELRMGAFIPCHCGLDPQSPDICVYIRWRGLAARVQYRLQARASGRIGATRSVLQGIADRRFALSAMTGFLQVISFPILSGFEDLQVTKPIFW
jgi:hypothetical protein